MPAHRRVAVLLLVSVLAFGSRPTLATVPPSADWIEVQRYTGGAPEGPFHAVYLIPNGSIIYLVRISNFAKASASPISVLQSLDLLLRARPPGHAIVSRSELLIEGGASLGGR